ncbi:MAG: SurA N-terminal domain-containing protein [Candidatus Accumulibacter sp.]|nr:SurA N-terminal domain-containing protein [Accumulibacter sp.]
MFDAVRNNKRIVQVFLGLITLPFAFWGIESYMGNLGAGNDLASVGDTKISYPQFEQALRDRQDQLRQSMGDQFKLEMMNAPQTRLGILNDLINQRLLSLEVASKRLTTSDQELQNYIANIPAFQENGTFSQPRYEAKQRARGMSPEQFEARARQELTLRQLIGAVDTSAFVSSTQAEALLRIQTEERKFNEFTFATAPFAEKLTITPETARKFYDENQKRFEVPEQVKVEYIVLSLDALMSQVTVSETEIAVWYDGHLDRYQRPEERRASHILIMPDGDGGKEKAKTQAEAVLKEVRENPSRFADLAKQHSRDPGSAEKGGDLGFFSRGMMVKPFDDAVFGLKNEAISGLVETEYGYHIIKVTAIRELEQKPLREVSAEIADELKRQTASRQFAEAAETFSNMVYEESDSLQPAAARFRLKIEQTDWLPKNAGPQARAALGPLDNDKVLAALFSEDAIKNRRNTEALEVASNTLLSARVTEHAAAALHPFDAVKDGIEQTLKNDEAVKQAASAGEARLAELQKGEDQVAWSETRVLSRQQARQSPLPAAALQAIFKADARKLPAYAGVNVGDGYALFRITEVARPDKIDEDQLNALKNEYANLVAQEDLSVYLASLRSRCKIDINRSLLENRER